jgi:RNA recognition motif-containing protein
MTKLYVGNLNFETTEDDLKAFFAEVAQVSRVNVIRDKFTNQSRGFAFVEIESADEAGKAIATLNGRTLKERALKVNEAKPMENRGGGGGGGGARRF